VKRKRAGFEEQMGEVGGREIEENHSGKTEIIHIL